MSGIVGRVGGSHLRFSRIICAIVGPSSPGRDHPACCIAHFEGAVPLTLPLPTFGSDLQPELGDSPPTFAQTLWLGTGTSRPRGCGAAKAVGQAPRIVRVSLSDEWPSAVYEGMRNIRTAAAACRRGRIASTRRGSMRLELSTSWPGGRLVSR